MFPLCAGERTPELCQLGDCHELRHASRVLSSYHADYPHKPGGLPQPGERVFSEQADTWVFTGGIGDFLAVDPYLEPAAKDAVRTILLANRQQGGLAQLLKSCERYKGCQVECVWTAWDRDDFFTKEELLPLVRRDDLDRARDISPNKVFPQILTGELEYDQSAFLEQLAPVRDLFAVPEYFWTIQPSSTNENRGGRNFTQEDWDWVLSELEGRNAKGLVLGTGAEWIPRSAHLVDLRGKTTLPEALELVAASNFFAGCASCLSIYAAMLMTESELYVKAGDNEYLWDHKTVYYPLKQSWDWLKP